MRNSENHGNPFSGLLYHTGRLPSGPEAGEHPAAPAAQQPCSPRQDLRFWPLQGKLCAHTAAIMIAASDVVQTPNLKRGMSFKLVIRISPDVFALLLFQPCASDCAHIWLRSTPSTTPNQTRWWGPMRTLRRRSSCPTNKHRTTQLHQTVLSEALMLCACVGSQLLLGARTRHSIFTCCCCLQSTRAMLHRGRAKNRL